MKKLLIVLGVIILVISSTALAKEFTDIGERLESYKGAISYLSEKEIISGYTDGTFKPEKLVTRAEVIKMIVASFDIKFKDGTNKSIAFDDVKGKWFEDYVEIGVSNGIIKGYEDSTFRPDNNVTYGELCAMVCRLLNLKVDEGDNWAKAYLDAAGALGLLDNIMTNDVIEINKIPRMNVAMILYNAINLENQIKEETKSGEAKPEEKNKPDETKQEGTKQEETKPSSNASAFKVNGVYFAKVVVERNSRGIDYVDIEMSDGTVLTLEVKKAEKKPSYDSMIIFKVKEDGGISLIKELKPELLRSEDFLIVKEAKGELAVIEDGETLDITLDSYNLDGKTIKLDRLDYYLVEVSQNSKNEYEYDDGEVVNKDSMKFQKEDRILFDTANDIAIIIRGMESEEE